MPVRVVTDSAASVEAGVGDRLGIVVVPMQVEIGGRPVGERDVSLEELVAHLDDGVRTSGPAPGAFLQVLEHPGSTDGTVVVTVAEHLSSTFQAARTAAIMTDDPERVRVVDSGTAAGAEGLVVLAAAEAARTGRSLEEVERVARHVSDRTRLVAAVEQLQYLARGGRVPGLAARTGDLLGVRPLFELSRAHLRPLRPALGAARAREQIVSRWRRSRPQPDAPLHVAVLHALRPEEAEALLASVTAEVKPETSFVGTFGPVMVAHTGPGVIGLAWWWGSLPAGPGPT